MGLHLDWAHCNLLFYTNKELKVLNLKEHYIQGKNTYQPSPENCRMLTGTTQENHQQRFMSLHVTCPYQSSKFVNVMYSLNLPRQHV